MWQHPADQPWDIGWLDLARRGGAGGRALQADGPLGAVRFEVEGLVEPGVPTVAREALTSGLPIFAVRQEEPVRSGPDAVDGRLLADLDIEDQLGLVRADQADRHITGGTAVVTISSPEPPPGSFFTVVPLGD
mgnify:CR=1 FL=1